MSNSSSPSSLDPQCSAATAASSQLIPFDVQGIQETYSSNAASLRALLLALASEPPVEGETLSGALREYYLGMAAVWAPVVGFAVVGLVLWVPLFISRCCAHRCCAPTNASKRRACCGILNWLLFLLLSLALTACAATGVVAANDVNAVVDKATCAAAHLVQDVWYNLGQLAQRTGDLSEALRQASEALLALEADRRCVDANASAADAVCGRVGHALERVAQIGAYLDDPAGPEYVELHDAYKRAFDLCADFNSAVAAQASALDAPAATLGELMAHGAAVAGFASSASSEAQLLAVEFGNQTAVLVASLPRTNWPLLVAIGAFLAPLLVVPIALMFAPCMLAHGSRTGALAVQCVGFSWVVACILSFVYLMLGAISYVVGNTLFDVIGFGYTVPVAFVETFNNTIVCGGRVPDRLTFEEAMQLDLSTSQGASCLVLGAALNGCAQGDQLVGSILSAFDAPFTLSSLRADLTAALGTLGNGSLLNATVALALPELLAAVEGARALTGNASAASLGNSSDPAAVQAALDEAEAVAAAVGAQADDPDSPLSALRRCMVSLATVTIDALRAAGDTVLFALDALDANDVCTFFVVLWEGLLGNLDELTALFSLLGSVGFLGCGFLYFFYVPSAIAMQVGKGEVGSEPGCPRRCRPNCCGCRDEPSSDGLTSALEMGNTRSANTSNSPYGNSQFNDPAFDRRFLAV